MGQLDNIKNNETLFSYKGKSDSKHILNTCNKVVSRDILDKIESGITLEDLDEIKQSGLDIYKYYTQITIHGLFPELEVNYFGGYKSLFQNKNKSIGVRWSAIDYKKRVRIYSDLERYGFSVVQNSTEHSAYQKKYVTTPKELNDCANKYNEIAKRIDKSLFYGYVNIYAARTMFGVACVLEIGINAIYEKNVETLIEQITGANKEAREQLRMQKEQEYQAKIQRRKEEQILRQQEAQRTKEEFLKSDNLGWEVRREEPQKGLIFAKLNYDDSGWNFYIVTKVAKKYYYYTEIDKNGKEISSFIRRGIIGSIKAYFKPNN